LSLTSFGGASSCLGVNRDGQEASEDEANMEEAMVKEDFGTAFLETFGGKKHSRPSSIRSTRCKHIPD
jgi:hypothetical protein